MRASVAQVSVSRIDKIQIGGITVDSIKRIKNGPGITKYYGLSSDSLTLTPINGGTPFAFPNGSIVYMPTIDQYGRVTSVLTTNATPFWGNIVDTPNFVRFSAAVDSLLKRQRYTDTSTYDATKYDLSFKLNYTDTAAMLSSYMRKSDTISMNNRMVSMQNMGDTSTWDATKSFVNASMSVKMNFSDTAALSNRINTKQAYADTNTWDATKANINGKINYTDSSAMLLGYLRKNDTVSLSNRINNKQSYSDTSSWDATKSWVMSQGYSTSSGSVSSVGVISSDLSVSGSPVTTSGNITVNLNNSGIAPGSYAPVTVSAKGIITAGKRFELYSGTTNGSGNYTVTFSTPFSVAPHIQVTHTNPANNLQFSKVSSCTTTGFTVNVYAFSQVTSLPIIGVLAGALVGVNTYVVSGATLDVTIIEK